MLKTMLAKYPGRCAVSGARINPGDEITFDTVSRKAWFTEPGDCQVEAAPVYGRINPHNVSDVFRMGSREYYRNKSGRCEDAPCCGCCTI
jgi:hypothetical protein